MKEDDFETIFANLKTYLAKVGWVANSSNYSGLEIWTPGQPGLGLIELVLPKDYKTATAENQVENAIGIIAAVNGISKDDLIRKIRGFELDFHLCRILQKNSNNIPLLTAEKLITSARIIFQEAAKEEYSKYHASLVKPKKDKEFGVREMTDLFLKGCKFGHTWRGSFGITIENPLNTPSSVNVTERISDTLPRKVSKRIYSGLRILAEAADQNDVEELVKSTDVGLNIRMWHELYEIGENVLTNPVEYSIYWGPAIEVETQFEETNNFQLNRKTYGTLFQAIEKVGLKKDEYVVNFLGFPELFKSSKNDLFSTELLSDRQIAVRGYSEETGKASLRMNLELSDYKNAIHAHDQGFDVLVKCRVKRRVRGWDVSEVIKFEVLENDKA